ncbi:hypothetical protein C8024_01110 [Sphingopyxis sp. BSNA05]|uniref:hypothetical protein n=1 Tax=Sphingopyxis sp. BSNA05 TaxID=1236614 RepID=UPI001566CE5F|nr:hypothetical protein [Sphingopyxis sp. BSNA05]NRD88358.1 hypothetical protein [Sphingopyxis sp. BSNA05]
MTPEKRLENLRKEQDAYSAKVSETSRYIGYGLVAAAFSLLSRATEFSKGMEAFADNLLVWAAICGCIAVSLDYLQMLMGWLAASQAANNGTEYKQTKRGKQFQAVLNFSFYSKQVVAISGVLFC